MSGAIDWAQLFRPDVLLLEIFVRGACLYLGPLALLRLTPSREIATVSHTNLLVIVLLADASQNAMSGEYRSITDGLFLVGTLLFWSVLIDAACYRWPWFRRLVQPPPVRLIRNGRINARAMRSELLSPAELETQLPDGQLSVIGRETAAGRPR